MSSVLCVDDEPSVAVVLENALKGMGHHPVLASTLDEALKAINRETIDLIISDHQLSDGTGLELLAALRQGGFEIPVVMTSGYTSIEDAVLSIRHGAVDYLTKPLRAEALRLAVNNAIELDKMRRANENFRREISSLRGVRAIVGQGPAFQHIMALIASVAPTRAAVLLEGESGTGKELFARALHEQSPRAAESFITVNCAALPEGLVESTLFGHERGAFTGAAARAQGAFERANRGTLLLDEVSEMRLDLQAKLLRAIQEQEFERVGGNESIKVDVRIIATTNRALRQEVTAGRFRSDLYFRLNVMPIHTPPLRDRLEDLPLLVDHFIERSAASLGMRAPRVLPETVAALRARPWVGNVRELANVVERAVILCKNGVLSSEAFGGGELHFWPAPGASPLPAPTPGAAEPEPTREEATFNLDVLERITIRKALESTGGHRTKAALLLGISERTLRNKLKL